MFVFILLGFCKRNFCKRNKVWVMWSTARSMTSTCPQHS